MILAGDIGGTKSNLALMEKEGDGLRVVFLHRYPSHEYTRFEDIIEDFLGRVRQFLSVSALGRIQAAGFGVAGPVLGRGVRITNLAWGIDAAVLALGILCCLTTWRPLAIPWRAWHPKTFALSMKVCGCRKAPRP
jgi:glucokinase